MKMKKIKIQGNVITTDELLPCPFCNNKAVMFLSQKGKPTQKYYIATVCCDGYSWVVKEVHKDGMTGACKATMTEAYNLRSECIEEIHEQDLEIAVELLTKRWNNRPEVDKRT